MNNSVQSLKAKFENNNNNNNNNNDINNNNSKLKAPPILPPRRRSSVENTNYSPINVPSSTSKTSSSVTVPALPSRSPPPKPTSTPKPTPAHVNVFTGKSIINTTATTNNNIATPPPKAKSSAPVHTFTRKSIINTNNIAPPNIDKKQDDSNKNEGTCFRKLSHEFVSISDHVENGLYMLKRMIIFLRKIASLIDTFVNGITKVTIHETGKEKLKLSNMPDYQRSWSNLQELLQTHCIKHTQFKMQILEVLLPPLQDTYKELELDRGEIMKKLRAIQQSTKKASNLVKSSKKTALKYLSNLKSAMQRAHEDKADKETSLFAHLKDKLNDFRDSVPVLKQKAEQACRSYSQAIHLANENKIRTSKEEMPLIMDRLHDIEVRRLKVTKECVKNFGEVYDALTAPLATLGKELLSDVTHLSPVEDVLNFAEQTLKVFGESTMLLTQHYDLPCTADDILNDQWEGNMDLVLHDSIYGASIETVMKLQSKIFPNEELPLVFTRCIHQIIKLNGVNEQGIFRISAKKSDLDQIRSEFNKQNYNILDQYKSPHVAAGALKQWLRELRTPLISNDDYDKCIALAKKSEEMGQETIPTREIMSIIKALPDINQRMINKLVELFRLIVKNSDINMMTVGNIAIVFAPSFLRCEDEDPLQMMMNSKYESQFVSDLLKILIK